MARCAALAAVVSAAGCDLLTSPPDPPGPPGGALARAAGAHQVELTWQPPEGGAATFELERGRGGAEPAPLTTVPGEQAAYLDQGLEPSTLYRYRIRSCNEGGCSSFSSVAQATTFALVQVATSVLPDAAVGDPYTAQLGATGGDGSYTWSLVEGALPPGLSLASSGLVSGTPGAAGLSTFTVEVRSEGSGSHTRALELRVLPAAPVEIRTFRLPPALEGGSYEVVLEAQAGTAQPVWSVVDGGLPAGLALDAAGVLTGAPTEVGAFTFRVEAANGPEADTADLELEVLADRTDTYDVTVIAAAPLSAGVAAAVAGARERWEEIVVGDLPAVWLPPGLFGAGECFGLGDLVEGTSLDDMIVLLEVAPIDGPGNTLARAAPCLLRSAGSFPAVGAVTLDAADGDALAPELLVDLLVHEIAHTVGFGTLWEPLLQGQGTVTPTFTGTGAVGEWQALGGSGNVPVEGGSGPGTNDAHWRESVFGSELMTGFLNQGSNPVSRVTVASLADLGYQVDLEAADSFALPAPALPSAVGVAVLGWDVVPSVVPRRLERRP